MWLLSSLSPRGRRIMALAAILLALIVGYEYWRWHPRHGAVSFYPQYAITLKGYDGSNVKLSSFKHKPIVVHAWASWCVYCADEIRQLSAMRQKYGNKFEIVAPNRAESLIDAKTFSDTLQTGSAVTYLLDPNDTYYKSIQGYAMPETLFVNDRGEVVLHQRGPIGAEAESAAIERMLK